LSHQIENPARIDPVTVAVYERAPRGNAHQREATTTCSLTSGAYDLYQGAIDLDCFRFPGETSTALTAYRQAAGADANSKLARNRMISILMSHSDQVCTRELGRMSAVEAATNSSLSIASSALSTLATIVTGERANAILSGGSTFFGATRDHIRAEVYRTQMAPVVSSAIVQERNRLRESIERRFADDAATWSIDQGIRAVNEYHQTCSFYRGLELVTLATAQRTELESRSRLLAVETRIGELEALKSRNATEEALLTRLRAERIRLTTDVVGPS
jgi:hypothetical protein